MYCPVCRCEYIEGITQCVDCQTPLVDQIPDDPDELPYELRDLIIFKCFPHRHEAEIAASLLQTHGIDAITTLEDWAPRILTNTAQTQQGVRLMIRASDLKQAETIFQEAGIPIEETSYVEAKEPTDHSHYGKKEKLVSKILLILSILMLLAAVWTFF